jgi:hypothetical protein
VSSPITSLARGYVRSRATAVMEYTCRIERLERPTYDDTSLIATSGTRTTIYEGVCRIWELASSGVVHLGEVDVTVQSTQLSIPWDTSPVPMKEDEVLILSAPQDSELIGARFIIRSSAKAGELRATRRFAVDRVTFENR